MDGDTDEEAGTVGEHTRDDIAIQPETEPRPDPPEDGHTPDDVDGDGIRGWASGSSPARTEIAAAALAGWIVVDPDDADDPGHPIRERTIAAAPSVERLTLPVDDPDGPSWHGDSVSAEPRSLSLVPPVADEPTIPAESESEMPAAADPWAAAEPPGEWADTDLSGASAFARVGRPGWTPEPDLEGLAVFPIASAPPASSPPASSPPASSPPASSPPASSPPPSSPPPSSPPASSPPASSPPASSPFASTPFSSTPQAPAPLDWAPFSSTPPAPAPTAPVGSTPLASAPPAAAPFASIATHAGQPAQPAPEKPLDEPDAAVLARQIEAARRHLQAALVVANGPAAPRRLGALLTAIEQVLTAVTDLARETRGLLESGLADRTFPGEARFLCSAPWEGTSLVGRDAYGDDVATPAGLAKLLRALGYEAHSVTSAGGAAGVQIRGPRYSMQVALVEPAGGGRQRWSGALEWVDESGANRTWAETLGPVELEDEELARRVDELLRRSVVG